jgi:glycosyltransferase involved in cell wall biosynthesis
LFHAGIAARLAGVRKLIHYEHDVWHYEDARHRWITYSCSKILRPSHVAVSAKTALRLEAIVGRHNIPVLAPGIDTCQFVVADRNFALQRLGLDTKVRWIGTVGRLVDVKNQKMLVDVLSVLGPEYGLILVGDGPQREALQRRAAQLGLSKQVVLLGKRGDVSEILPALDVFCMTSVNEGLPRSVLEAQSCGVPVVATDVGSVAEAVCSASGEVVKPGDPAGFAKAVLRCVAKDGLSEITRRHIVERYSISNVAAALEKFAVYDV